MKLDSVKMFLVRELLYLEYTGRLEKTLSDTEKWWFSRNNKRVNSLIL